VKIFKVLNYLVIYLVRFYQICISPITPNVCRFKPTCSKYVKECFERFSFFTAMKLSIYRIFRCHPFCKGGYDPVPDE